MVSNLEVFIGIGSILTLLSLIVLGFALHTTGVLSIIIELFAWLRNGLNTFFDMMPNALKFFMFLFLIVGIAPFVFGLWINFQYACTTTNELRTPTNGYIGGVAMAFTGIFEGYKPNNNGTSNQTYNSFISNRTVPVQQYGIETAEGMFSVRCISQYPTLTFFGIDFLNYRYWIMLFLITVLIRGAQLLR